MYIYNYQHNIMPNFRYYMGKGLIFPPHRTLKKKKKN